MSIVENIKSLCKTRNITIPKLELEIGLSKGSIYNWDKNSPSIDKIQKVAEYFKVSTDYLIYGFHRGWLAAGLKIIRGERTFTQFAQDTGIGQDELHELCAGTARKQPSLDTIEKIIISNTFHIPPRNEILEAAGYDPEEVTAYPKLHLRIKELREKDKLTIEELGEKSEVDVSVLRLYEAGEMNNTPDPYVLAQIADVFDCTPDYLLGLANNFYRARFTGYHNDEPIKFIELIDELIKGIDPYKYRNQRHQKDMNEIEEYRKQKNLITPTTNDETLTEEDLTLLEKIKNLPPEKRKAINQITETQHQQTIAAHRTDDPTSELPEVARESIENFKKFIYEKHGIKYD